MPLDARLLAANSGHSVQTRTAPEGAAFDLLVFSYAFFLLAIPIKPSRPEPKSQTAAGIGTEFTSMLVSKPSSDGVIPLAVPKPSIPLWLISTVFVSLVLKGISLT